MQLPRPLHAVWKAFVKTPRPPSPLHKEVIDLTAKIYVQLGEMNELEAAFFADDPYGCCPGCGVDGWYRMEEQLARRQKRLAELEAKICRDTQIRVDCTL